MKLHIFSSGRISCRKHLLVRGAPEDEHFSVPVPFYLLEHSQGVFLFDTGQQVPSAPLPQEAAFIPVIRDEERAVNQLKARGISAGDISGIILSHRHSDHVEGLSDFPGVQCFVRREELDAPELADAAARDRRRWIHPQGVHDLCGDGKILLIPTPGHTAGHQSLLLTLDNGERVLLTADAAYTEAALQDTPPAGEEELPYWTTLEKIRALGREGVRIITGHDPESWPLLQALFP